MSSALAELKARVAFVKNQARNLRPAVNLLHREFIADRKTDFATGGTTTAHGAWRKNKPSTIKRKGHGRPLFGVPSQGYQLHKSITNSKHRDHIFNWLPGGPSIEIGTKHWKAHIHQLGLGPGGIRRPIDPTTAQRKRYASILTTWVLTGKLG